MGAIVRSITADVTGHVLGMGMHRATNLLAAPQKWGRMLTMAPWAIAFASTTEPDVGIVCNAFPEHRHIVRQEALSGGHRTDHTLTTW